MSEIGLPRLLEEGRVEVRLVSGGTSVLTLASIGALMDHLAEAAKLLGHKSLDEKCVACNDAGQDCRDCELTQLRADLARAEGEREHNLKVIQEMTTLLCEGSSAIAKLSASPAVAHLCMELRKKEAAEKERNEWRDAILDAAVVNWVPSKDKTPREIVNALLAWESQVALDPAVSEPAAKLVEERDTLKAECERLKGIEAERVEIGGKYQAALIQLTTSREEGYRQGMELLKEAFTFCCLRDGDGDFLNEHLTIRIRDYLGKAESSTPPRTALEDGEPCNHPGCLHHVTHPCEGCGRVGGRSAPRAPTSRGAEECQCGWQKVADRDWYQISDAGPLFPGPLKDCLYCGKVIRALPTTPKEEN